MGKDIAIATASAILKAIKEYEGMDRRRIIQFIESLLDELKKEEPNGQG